MIVSKLEDFEYRWCGTIFPGAISIQCWFLFTISISLERWEGLLFL